MRRLALSALVALVIVAITGCGASVRGYLGLKETIDREYASIIEQRSRKSVEIVDMDPKFEAKSVKLDPEVKKAFRDYYAKSSGPVGKDDKFYSAVVEGSYLISINSPDIKYNDLTDPNLWNIFIESSSGKRVPSLHIRKIEDRLRAKNFFPVVNDWSDVFIVVLPAGKESGTLHLRGNIGNARFSWD